MHALTWGQPHQISSRPACSTAEMKSVSSKQKRIKKVMYSWTLTFKVICWFLDSHSLVLLIKAVCRHWLWLVWFFCFFWIAPTVSFPSLNCACSDLRRVRPRQDRRPTPQLRTVGFASSKAIIRRSQVLLRCLSLAANCFFRKSSCCVFAQKSISLFKMCVDWNTIGTRSEH